ncbi:uncharacterized protein LOC134466047 [Engraulis encrasicolus]|uniref:uncharacterized protein LOC134466047 n=1 Tax=Engraulis encrasicolus TaxID=184585 RepID=UPI002FD2A93C
MSSTLRRTQSLKNVSESQRSWASPATPLWHTKKSVSQLVQQYQSCAELRTVGIEENGPKRQLIRDEAHTTKAATPPATPKQLQGHLWDEPAGFRGWTTLSRSRSMESLPQRAPPPVGTNALRALFESKNALQQDFSSSPRLNSNAASAPSTPVKRTPVTPTATPAREPASAPLGEPKRPSGEVTPAKRETTRQRVNAAESARPERRKTVAGVPGSLVKEAASPRVNPNTTQGAQACHHPQKNPSQANRSSGFTAKGGRPRSNRDGRIKEKNTFGPEHHLIPCQSTRQDYRCVIIAETLPAIHKGQICSLPVKSSSCHRITRNCHTARL